MSLHFLSHLLPYDPEIKKQHRLKNGLNEYLMLLVAAEESMKSFQRGELSKFDPLVGENSCQIRAVKVAIIASNISFDIEELLSKISFSKKSIGELLDKVAEFSTQEKTLKWFLQGHQLDVPLNADAIFLIKSYILSKVKVVGGKNDIIKFCKNEKTVSRQIKEFGDVSGGFADSLIRELREQLSKSSAQFVQDITNCPLLEAEEMKEIISDFSIFHKGLHCTPFYWMTKLIMHQAFVSKIPIVMLAEQRAQDLDHEVLEETTLFFHSTESGYRITTRDLVEENQPVMVFNVVSCRNSNDFLSKESWEKELTEHNLVDLVLACNASHRQYPDPSKEHLIQEIQDESYFYHLEKAQEWGCHLENPFRFLLTHIYCDQMKNI